jgi:hypothetical protein
LFADKYIQCVAEECDGFYGAIDKGGGVNKKKNNLLEK